MICVPNNNNSSGWDYIIHLLFDTLEEERTTEGRLHIHSQQLIMHEYPIYLHLPNNKRRILLSFHLPDYRATTNGESSVKSNLKIINYAFSANEKVSFA